jgi:hypothetical protein
MQPDHRRPAEVAVPWKRQVLVVANVTAGSDELLRVLRERAQREPIGIHLIVPATPLGGGRRAAARTLEEALGQLREAGLEADGSVGDSDPTTATVEAWDPRRYDEIVVSTLPIGVSKWLHAGLPERIERLTGAPVTHVVSTPPRQAAQAGPPPSRNETDALLGPLSVLGWGPSAADRRRSAPRDGHRHPNT